MPIENLIESSLSRVQGHQLKHDTGIMSAFRYAPDCGAGKPYTKSDNKKRNKVLKASLYALGYGVTKVDGTYVENFSSPKDIADHAIKFKKDPTIDPLPTPIEVDEDSFFVVDLNDTGKLKSDLIKLGRKWEQDSILYIAGGSKKGGVLIGTNNCPSDFIKKGQVIPQGGAVFGATGEFMSKVNGRTFVLRESDREYKQRIPRGYHGKLGNKILSEKNWHDLED